MENIISIQEQRHNRYLQHRKQRIVYATEWCKNNKEKTAIHMKRYMRKNKQTINDNNTRCHRNRCSENPSYKAKTILSSQHTQFLSGIGTSFSNMVGLSLEEYKAHIETLWKPHMNWNNYGKQWQIRRYKNWKELDLTVPEEKEKFCNFKNVYLISINQND